MLTWILAVSALAAGACAQAPKVTIGQITYGGTGCPQGTVSTLLSSDRTAFTLLFDSYVATAGPLVAITESRKACQIAAQINVPNGWSYSVGTIDYRGYVQVPQGGLAVQSATYYFQGMSQQTVSRTSFTGPADRDYLVRDVIPLESIVWSQCNANIPVNIKTAVQLRVPTGKSGIITTDSIDAKVAQVYGLQFRQC